MKGIRRKGFKVASWLIKYNDLFRVTLIGSVIVLSVKGYQLDKRVDFLEQENYQLKMVNAQIIANNISGTRALDKVKVPIWAKLKRGDKFVMQVLNEEFEKEYLTPGGLEKYDYIGRTDFDIFPYESAKQFSIDDTRVAITGQDVIKTEIFTDVEGEVNTAEVIKWRDIVNKDTLVWGIVQKKIK